jgi:hypothetical protein
VFPLLYSAQIWVVVYLMTNMVCFEFFFGLAIRRSLKQSAELSFGKPRCTGDYIAHGFASTSRLSPRTRLIGSPRDLLTQTALEHNMVKPHDRLVLLGSELALFTPIAYQPGSLPGVFSPSPF